MYVFAGKPPQSLDMPPEPSRWASLKQSFAWNSPSLRTELGFMDLVHNITGS